MLTKNTGALTKLTAIYLHRVPKSNVVSLLIKSILGCVLPQILYAHVVAVGKVVERLGVPSV